MLAALSVLSAGSVLRTGARASMVTMASTTKGVVYDPHERYVEADVGMKFVKQELTEALFEDPTGTKEDTGSVWPPGGMENVFPPQATC